MDILLIFLVTQILSALAMRCPEGQIQHTFCCVPVWSCREGYYIKTCEREGAEDKCMKCPRGTDNPFNSSSFDLKKCYKKICKLSDSVSVSDNTCECDRSKGWFGENSLACQLKYGGCPAGEELTQKGRCERCTNFHYKDWQGYGFCVRHFDCSRLQMVEIKGNATHANKCLKKDMVPHKTTTATTSTRLKLSSSATTSTKASAPTTKASTTKSSIRGRNAVLKNPVVSPTEFSQRLPVVGNRAPSDKEVARSGRIEGILIVVVAILCFLLLCVVCIGTIAYLRRRLKSSPNVTIPQRPALPLPSAQNEQHLGGTFAPPIYQSQRQTQPLLQHENPYLCMSNPHQSCIYALPASLHLNNQAANYSASRSSSVFDTVSTYGLNYNPSQNRPISTVSPNSLGSQQRHEHLYMTLPAERSESGPFSSPLAPAAPTTPAAMTTLTTVAAATTTAHHEPMSLENRNSTVTENFYEFP